MADDAAEGNVPEVSKHSSSRWWGVTRSGGAISSVGSHSNLAPAAVAGDTWTLLPSSQH